MLSRQAYRVWDASIYEVVTRLSLAPRDAHCHDPARSLRDGARVNRTASRRAAVSNDDHGGAIAPRERLRCRRGQRRRYTLLQGPLSIIEGALNGRLPQ